MGQIYKYLLLITLANWVHPDFYRPWIPTGPLGRQLSLEELHIFRIECGRKLLNQVKLLALGAEIFQKPYKFMKPCEICRLIELEIDEVFYTYDIHYRSRNNGTAFDTTIVFPIKHYKAECDCDFNTTGHDVMESFKEEYKHLLSDSCHNELQDSSPSFQTKDVEKCLKMIHHQKHTRTRMVVTGRRIAVHSSVRYDMFTEEYTLYDKLSYHTIAASYKVTCPEGNDKIPQTCECLQDSNLFEFFSRTIVSHIVPCPDNHIIKHEGDAYEKLSCINEYLNPGSADINLDDPNMD